MLYVRNPFGFGSKLKRLSDRFEQLANAKLSEKDLTFAQALMLLTLRNAYDTQMTMKTLGGLLNISQPTTVGIVARLCTKKLLTTSQDYCDHRAKIVTITKSGEDLCPFAHAAIESAESELLSEFSESDATVLRRILENFGND